MDAKAVCAWSGKGRSWHVQKIAGVRFFLLVAVPLLTRNRRPPFVGVLAVSVVAEL